MRNSARAGRNAITRINFPGHVTAGAIGKREGARAEKAKARNAPSAEGRPQLTHPASKSRSEAARIACHDAGGNWRCMGVVNAWFRSGFAVAKTPLGMSDQGLRK